MRSKKLRIVPILVVFGLAAAACGSDSDSDSSDESGADSTAAGDAASDLDGTLLNSLEDLGDAVNLTLRERDLPEHPYPFFRHAVGDGASMLITRSLPENLRDHDTVEAAHDSLRQHYATTWNIKTHTYAGIVDMLRTLKQQGIVQAILSNKPQAPLVQCVDCFLPADQFIAIH